MAKRENRLDKGLHFPELLRQKLGFRNKPVKSNPKKINNPLNAKDLIQELKEYIKKEKEFFHKFY